MSTDYDVRAYGAMGDGLADDTAAVQRAIDAAHAAGGGRVVISTGTTVRAGSFELRSAIELHVAAGATLRSATDIESFPRTVFSFGPEQSKRLWIGCRHCTDVTLSGHGVIDGQCHAFALGESEHIYLPTLPWRPALTCFEDVHRVTVRDLTFRNAANWTLHFSGCTDVLVEDVRIDNDLRFPNADGIDPDHCRRVKIRRCQIAAGDDCIVLKNTAPFAQYGPCEDIEIEDCVLQSTSAAFKIGSESVDAFRRVQLRHCQIVASNRALAIQLRDQGRVEDVLWEDVQISTRRFAPIWWGGGEAIYVTAVPRTAATTVGGIFGLTARRIRAEGEGGVLLFAHPGVPVEGLHFDDVEVRVHRTTAWEAGLFDVRPCLGGYLPTADCVPLGDDTPWGRPAMRPPAVVSADHIAGLDLSGLRYRGPQNDPRPWLGERAQPAWRRPPVPLAD